MKPEIGGLVCNILKNGICEQHCEITTRIQVTSNVWRGYVYRQYQSWAVDVLFYHRSTYNKSRGQQREESESLIGWEISQWGY